MSEMLVILNPRGPGYTAGDVVTVAPDGFLWGTQECPPKFVVVRSRLTVAEARAQFCKPHVTGRTATLDELDAEFAAAATEGREPDLINNVPNPTEVYRRRRRLDLTSLRTAARRKIQNAVDGEPLVIDLAANRDGDIDTLDKVTSDRVRID